MDAKQDFELSGIQHKLSATENGAYVSYDMDEVDMIRLGKNQVLKVCSLTITAVSKA